MGDNPIAAFRRKSADYITGTWQAAANRPTTRTPATMRDAEDAGIPFIPTDNPN